MVFLRPTACRFPYTTLFRSQRIAPERSAVRSATDMPVMNDRYDGKSGSTHGDRNEKSPELNATATPRDSLIDRKSTRLNSSHTVISYAVFCLKKKNETGTSHGSLYNFCHWRLKLPSQPARTQYSGSSR